MSKLDKIGEYTVDLKSYTWCYRVVGLPCTVIGTRQAVHNLERGGLFELYTTEILSWNNALMQTPKIHCNTA